MNKGYISLIDDEDIENVNKFKWTYAHGYALSSYRKSLNVRGFIYLHRLIMKPPKDKVIDHINGNRLDNRKSNLRICTNRQNLMNRGAQKNSFSKYKGVGFHKETNKWRAYIKNNGPFIHLGLFKTELEAAMAYNNAAMKNFGRYAFLNEV